VPTILRKETRNTALKGARGSSGLPARIRMKFVVDAIFLHSLLLSSAPLYLQDVSSFTFGGPHVRQQHPRAGSWGRRHVSRGAKKGVVAVTTTSTRRWASYPPTSADADCGCGGEDAAAAAAAALSSSPSSSFPTVFSGKPSDVARTSINHREAIRTGRVLDVHGKAFHMDDLLGSSAPGRRSGATTTTTTGDLVESSAVSVVVFLRSLG
jgi:hypothetical protein